MVTSPGDSAPHALIYRSARRFAAQHPWQTGLNIIGIMIGVMMVVAVDLANQSARESFDRSLEVVNGTITHRITAGSAGVPESVFTRLKTELGIRRSAPSLSGRVELSGRAMTLLGMDVLSEAALQRQRPGVSAGELGLQGSFFELIGNANTVVVSRSTAADLGIQPGDRVTLATLRQSRELTLAGMFFSDDIATRDLLFADIAAAQRILDRLGVVDSIDLVLSDNEAARVAGWLPPGLTLVDARQRDDALRQMSEAFHVNLLAMGLLSLLVAALLIYNTVTLSVLQRRQTLGVFRSQGVTGREILKLVLMENLIAGGIASVAGVALGLLLGRYLVILVTRTVDDLYFDLSVSGYFIDPLLLVKGLLVGIGLSLLSSLAPAWRASLSRPVTLQQTAPDTGPGRSRMAALALAGVIMMAAGQILLLPEYGSLSMGFVALTLIIFGFCAMVPLVLYLSLTLLMAGSGKVLGISGVMALRSSRAGIARTGLAVAALSVAISVTVGVGVMVGSFRGTVILWLDQSLAGDIQITTAGNTEQGLPQALVAGLRRIDGVASLGSTVLKTIESEFGEVRLSVNELPAAQTYYLKQGDADQIARYDRGEGVIISEPLAYRLRLGIADEITLLTGRGMQAFPIVGVFYDYTSNLGLVGMAQGLYGQWWPAQNSSRLTLVLENDANDSGVLAAVNQLLAEQEIPLFAVSNRRLREITLQIFDRTFAITNVLRLLAILVAFVGVLSTLMALQLERAREFAILRATGMTPRQVAALILKQTTLLGIASGLLAIPLGLLMSDVLIDVINRRSFGWSMQHILPSSVLTEALLLAVVSALLAGLYPAVRAGKIRPALALRQE